MPINYWRLLLPAGYMVALVLLSSVPGDLPSEDPVGKVFQWVNPAWQNLLHVPLYAGLAASWLWALAVYRLNHFRRLALVFILTSIWAVLDELHQMSVPGRYGSLTDIALNLLGATMAVIYLGLKPFSIRPG
jgi:VanZ family protein